MGIFNIMGDHEHRVFSYKPIYYDQEAEERKKLFGQVDGSEEKKPYTPGSYIKGSFRDGNYQNVRSSTTKAQNIIGLVGLILLVVALFYIAKFYTLL